jgi:AAA+ ATPase superfamily predicted ATPase
MGTPALAIREDEIDAVPLGSLVERLAKGWKSSHADVAGDLIHKITRLLGAEMTALKYFDNAARFELDLGSSVRLAGMDNVKCLLLAGDARGVGDLIRDYWTTAGAAGRIGFIFAVSEAAHAEIREIVPSGRALVLNAASLMEVLNFRPPKQALLTRLRRQIPLRRLIPFRIEGPVWDHMFHGRRRELDRLKNEENTNFAVAGPSRIGKSSLLKRYREYELRKNRDPRLPSTFLINLYGQSHLSEEGLAQHIVLKIESGLKNSKLGSDRLRWFLEHQKQHFGRPVELLFDEVDSLIGLRTFQLLGEAARDGICRLILAGRGELAKMTLRQDSPFGCRVDWIRLEPLSEATSKSLFLDALADLGFNCPFPDDVIGKLNRWTGRLPHLIQLYGKEAAELMIKPEGASNVSINEELMQNIHDDAKTAAYVLSPLDDLSGRNREIALEILRKSPERITAPVMFQMTAGVGVPLTEQEVLRVCTELVICNILIWDGRNYQISNESLPKYARDLGFLDKRGTNQSAKA